MTLDELSKKIAALKNVTPASDSRTFKVSDARIPRARPARFLIRQRYSVADAVGTTAGCTSGTSNAESGAASSSGRSRARVADQCLGDSSRYRSRGQYGRTRKISSRYVKGSRR